MSYFAIEKALVDAVRLVAGATPTGWPAKELVPEEIPADSLWLQCYNQPSGTAPATLGDQGEDECRGFFQIDINVPKNKGTGEALNKADEFASAFTAGKSLFYNAQEVRITRTSLSPGRYVGNFYRVSLSVFYYARKVRNPT